MDSSQVDCRRSGWTALVSPLIVHGEEAHPLMDFDDHSDASLMAVMAMQANEPDAARGAFDTFYRRHVDYLHRQLEQVVGKSLGGAAYVDDLVIMTFLRTFKHCSQRGLDGGRDNLKSSFERATPEQSRRAIRAWLGTVANNLFKDSLRARDRQPFEALHEDVEDSQSSRDDIPVSLELVALAQAALDDLPPAAKRAFVACLPWYDPKTGNFDMGDDAKAVADSLDTNVGALKTARLRALKKLKAHHSCEVSTTRGIR